jgi:energy-coupling factor transporter ATP-binding protein EcfA2
MLLTSLRIENLGPFYHPVTISIDEQVTILTGANDTGKSTVLKCVELLLKDEKADEMLVNQDHIQESSGKWTEDRSLNVSGDFLLQKANDVLQQGYQHTIGDRATFTRRVAPHLGQPVESEVNSKIHGRAGWQIRAPGLVLAPSTDAVRDIIDLKNPNTLEKALLHAAFGSPFDHPKLAAMHPLNYTRALRAAEDRLNNHMHRVMPIESSLRFSLQPIEGSREKLGVLLRDRHDGLTPFGVRGNGLRRMISLFTELVTKASDANHRLILIDEPENSLHADAQHLLRELLFELGSQPNTQIIYSTHSPCMVNPMRPHQVRLFRRENRDGKANSTVESDACDKNFLGLRSSLGITAADSLLFGPVTVIVEGETEFLCLPLVFEKLRAGNVPGFAETRKLLSLAHFLDGMGDNFEYLCRVAESQGTRTVLFLDGDKRKVVEQQKVAEKHRDAKIILFPDRQEFEQLVPPEVYFHALSELLGRGDSAVMQGAWHVWVAKDMKRGKMMFSKQVWHWLEEEYEDIACTKPVVMRKAIELAKVDQINPEPLRQLLGAIQQQLQGSSFV